MTAAVLISLLFSPFVTSPAYAIGRPTPQAPADNAQITATGEGGSIAAPPTTWHTTIWGSHTCFWRINNEAIRHLQQAVDLAAEFERARNNLAVALKGCGDLEGAIYHLEQAIRINPTYAEAYNNLGLTWKDQGKLKEAIENFRRALTINPDYPAARLNLENAEAQLKRTAG